MNVEELFYSVFRMKHIQVFEDKHDSPIDVPDEFESLYIPYFQTLKSIFSIVK